jgi:TonB family protein
MIKKTSIIFPVILSIIVFVGMTNAQDNGNPNTNEKKTEKSEEKNKITAESRITQKTDENCLTSNIARLRVAFDKSGKVTDVELVLSTGCESLDEQAIAAARKIKFKPAKKDDKRVSIVKLVEYTFTIH